jgi:hypothetical protein
MKKNVDWNYLNRFFKNFPLFILLFTSAYAAVPSRITYQGRLSKSGVGAAGRHTITVQFITASGEKLPASQTFDVDVPVSGDFSLNIDNIPPDADWINGLPQMRVIVGGETLTPDQSFSATPYALVARNVENLDTTKVKLADTDGALLSSWQSPTDKTKINADVIVGTITTTTNHGKEHGLTGKDPLPTGSISPIQIANTAIVSTSPFSQVIQPSSNTTPLILRGNVGAGSETKLFQVFDHEIGEVERFSIKGSGTASFNGNVGIGTSAPNEKLEIDGNISFLGGNKKILFTDPGNYDFSIVQNGGTSLDIRSPEKDLTIASFINNGNIVFANGNLGIGTINPTSKLEVAGGDMTVGGKVIASSVEISGRYKDKTGDLSPAGTIVMYGGMAVPSGWLICDGSEISRSTFSDLFSAIGTTFGLGNNSTTFNLPDMRGAAPAGAGMSTGYPINELITLGKKHGDQFQGHRHLVREQNGVQVIGTTLNAGGGGYGTVEGNNTHGGHDRGPTEARDIISDGLNGAPQVSGTTRGKVVGLNFIIKY